VLLLGVVSLIAGSAIGVLMSLVTATMQTTCAAPACYTEAPNYYNTQVPKYYTTYYGALSCSKSFKRRDKVVEIRRVRISDTATTVVHYLSPIAFLILLPIRDHG
jgi:hypothetical protein